MTSPLIHGNPNIVIYKPERATHECPDCGARWEYVPADTDTHHGAFWSIRSPQWGDCCEKGDMSNMIPLNKALKIK